MKTNYVLIDYENVQVKSLALLDGQQFCVKVFLGARNTKLPRELVIGMQKLGSRGEYVELDISGHNALDFHIAYYLGVFSQKDPQGFYHVISKDTGFDPLIKHLKKQKLVCVRSDSIETMPCFAVAAANSAPVVSPTAAPVVAKLVVTKLAVTKSAAPKPVAAKPKPKTKTVTTPKSKLVDRKSNVEELVNIAVSDLNKRKISKPSTLKKLQATLHAMRGLKLSDEEVAAICSSLISKGYVKEVGKKLVYALPATN
jgi:hypothetical protein